MAKKTELKEHILELLKKNLQGLKIADLALAMNENPDNASYRRSLQRALKSLEHEKKITPKGNARARIYIATNKIDSVSRFESESVPIVSTIKSVALSKNAEKLFKSISQPTTKRFPVGYNQKFLKDYIPNKSPLLSIEQKKELMSLGKLQSSQKPFGTYARDLYQRLIIDLSWNSSRLEGNTYSLLETKRLIEFGEMADGKAASESQMILNHKAAIEFLIDSIDEIELNRLTICNIHALLSDNLLGDPSASGKIRTRSVQVSGSTYIPIDNPHLLNQEFDLFLAKANLIKDPFDQSFFILVYLPYLQSFEDVNKRTSRLSANIPLIKKNLKPLAFIDVDQDTYLKALLGIYEQNDVSLFRDLFIWAYKRSTQRYSAIQQSLGEPNLLKLKFRDKIQNIIRTLVKEKTSSKQTYNKASSLIKNLKLNLDESKKILEIIELEIATLHEGNIARYKIHLNEYKTWKKLK